MSVTTPATMATGARRPSAATLVVHQIRYQLMVFLRTPIAVFFTIMLPLFMLLLFNALFGGERIETPQGSWPVRQFYVGGLAAFTAVSATFTNLANVVPVRREEGILKRWRSTPLPPWVCIAGFVGAAIVVAAVGTTIMIGVGVVGYGVELDAGKVPVAVVTFVFAVATFAALGVAIAALIPTAEAAPAVANAIILPLAFMSDVFIQMNTPPAWMTAIGDVFPLRPFAQTFQDLFNPFIDGPNLVWDRLARIAAWGLFGVVVAATKFRWEPVKGGGGRRSRRHSGGGEGAEAAGDAQ